jgi:predicted Zn-dependent protease
MLSPLSRNPRTRTTARLAAMASLGLASCAFLAAGPLSCSTNPATGSLELNMLSRDQEIALGVEAAPQFAQEFGGGVTDPALQAYVRRIGADLAAKTEGDNPSLPWEFTLLNSKEINAFALPGGKIFFTRGLAERLTSEAEMAGVLGHEVGHVTARHANAGMARQGLTSLVISGAASVLTDSAQAAQQWQQIGEQVGGVILLKYSRDQESQADSLGMRYMARCNYNPRAQRAVMEVLQQAMSGGRPAEILSTHPYPETRIARIDEALRTDYASFIAAPGRAETDKQHAARYASEFLPRLRSLPAPAEPAPRGNQGQSVAPRRRATLDTETGALRFERIDLSNPVQWCAHCAAEAEAVAAR